MFSKPFLRATVASIMVAKRRRQRIPRVVFLSSILISNPSAIREKIIVVARRETAKV
jgi:hypothetical protein